MNLSMKYRPQRLSDVVGQSHITSVLSNVARIGQLSSYQALLFTGSRGLGKTTTARILAKLYNCPNSMSGEPCNTCKNCLTVERLLKSGTAGDVVELDAASNRGIDNIQNIIEMTRYYPTSGLSKRVFLIDEVAQLTGPAKDAFLKTLEEPPSHVVFILATTERGKVPATMASRCIPFVFREGSLDDIGGYLIRILTAEQISFEASAVSKVASLAHGSYRDAVKILEGLLMSGESLTLDRVSNGLGIPDNRLVGEAALAIITGEIAKAVDCATKAAILGSDMRTFTHEVLGKLVGALQATAKENRVQMNGISYTQLLDVTLGLQDRILMRDNPDAITVGLAMAAAASQAKESIR